MHKRLRAFEGMGGLLAVLLLAALSLRVLVPAGYMPVQASDDLVLSLCSGQGAVPAVVGMTVTGDVRLALPGDDDPRDRSRDSAAPCAFAALAAPALPLIAAPIVAIMPPLARAIAPPPRVPLPLMSAAFVRPPLRGPPTAA